MLEVCSLSRPIMFLNRCLPHCSAHDLAQSVSSPLPVTGLATGWPQGAARHSLYPASHTRTASVASRHPYPMGPIRAYPVPLIDNDGLGPLSPPAATSVHDGLSVSGPSRAACHFGSSLSAYLARRASRRLSRVRMCWPFHHP